MVFRRKNKNKFSRLTDFFKTKNDNPFVIQEGKFRFGQLKDPFYYSNWTEHVFLSGTESKEVVGKSFDFKRLKYFIAVIIFLILTLLFRALWLQVIKGDYYKLLAEGNRLRTETIEPNRGVIYDRNMKILVKNKANFVLYVVPINLPKDELKRDELIREVSNVLDHNSEKIENNVSGLTLVSDSDTFYRIKDLLSDVKIGSLKSYQPIVVADNIDYNTAIIIALKLSHWPGVFLSNKIRREYLYPDLSHILGYTGKINEKELKNLDDNYSPIDYIGKIGLEYTWEKELKGIVGKKNIEVDALGRQKKIINEIKARDGYNLVLSLDLDLQQEVEQVLQKYLKKFNARRAAVIILDPNNGEILSLVSWPTYNNNDFAKGIDQETYQALLNNPDNPLFNRAISGEFPSGSTIKIIFSAAALQEGIITDKTTFLSTGGLRINKWFFPDWKQGGHGLTNVRKAIAQSVNTFFYYIGGGYHDFKGLGVDCLVKYARLFGLGEKTGIDLYGETSGFVPTKEWKEKTKKEPWYIGDTYHFAIGQGDVLVTPLQVANYTAVIANQGTLYQPHLVKELMNDKNEVVQEIAPKVIRSNFIDQKNLQIVKEGMRQAVTQGSAYYLNSLLVKVAGKTGTAQWSTKHPPHAWFTGFAPYDHPQLVITVLVEEGNEGSQVSVPIAYDILTWYFGNKKSNP